MLFLSIPKLSYNYNLSSPFSGVGPILLNQKHPILVVEPHRLVLKLKHPSHPFESCQVFSGLTNMLTGPIVNDAVAKGDFIPLLVEAVGRK